jgi:putative adhesin
MYLLPMLALVAAPLQQGTQTDTTIAVSQGTRLRVENQGGDILVHAWDKNQVRIQASHSRRSHIMARLTGAVLSLEASADRGPGGMVDYELTVPAWMPLKLGGMYATVTVEGSKAPIEVETLEGDITIKGGAETVKLGSVQGKIVVSGTRGRLELNSVSEDVEASDIQGDIVVETVSGDVILRRIDAKSVEVETVSGELYFDGRVLDGGHYSLLTHSGEIYFSVAEGTNATIATAIGSGDVSASFPLPNSERPSRRRQTYRLGNGSATVELETFSGDINLLRPAEVSTRLDRLMRAREERAAERAREKQHKKPGWDGDHDHDRSEP